MFHKKTKQIFLFLFFLVEAVKAVKAVKVVVATKKAEISSEIVDINSDTQWTPTDTYGSLKRKLELANQIIAQLKNTK
jgi:multisubunit Na+/H+ antiporter MnhE subunit